MAYNKEERKVPKMNNTVSDFVTKFEEKFRGFLLDSSGHKKGIKITQYFRYDSDPNGAYSDWDLRCWLNLEAMSRNNMKQIDTFVRKFKGLSDVGLFSRPTLKIENGLQYMGYAPDESYAPFLDIHLRGPVDADIWSAVYNGTNEEHKRWALLTAWRKLKNSDEPGARRTYKDHFINYGYGNEEDEFIANPKVYYNLKFPDDINGKDVVNFLSRARLQKVSPKTNN